MRFTAPVRIGWFIAALTALGSPGGVAADFSVISAKGVELPSGLRRGGELASGVRIRLAAGGLLIVHENAGCRLYQVFSGEIDRTLKSSAPGECSNAREFEDVQPRILSGEPLAERVVLRGEGKADDFLTNFADDPCLNLPPMSEESGRDSRRCTSGYLLSGIECSGRYCDNKRLRCCPYLDGQADRTARNYSSRWISEETGGGRSNQYSTKDFINGLTCRGSYCDDLYPHATQSAHFRNTGVCRWTAFFSEEPPSKANCAGGSFVAGMKCSGSYCDNLSLQCCELRRQ